MELAEDNNSKYAELKINHHSVKVWNLEVRGWIHPGRDQQPWPLKQPMNR